MSDHGPYKLWSIPGDGVLARQGNLVLLTSIEDRGFAESLLDLLTRTNEAGGDGRALADAIGAAVERHQSWGGSQVGPSIVAFGPAGSGLAFTVSGAAFVEISTSHGKHRLVAGHPSMLLRSMVAVSVLTVRGGLGGNGPGDRTDRFTRLDSGTVRAWGMSYSAPPDAPPAAAGTPPAGEPAQVPRVPMTPQAEAAPPTQIAPPMPAAPQAQAAPQAGPAPQGRGAPEAEAALPFQAEPPAHATPSAQAIPDLAAPPSQARPPAEAPPQGQPAPQSRVEPPQGRTAPRPQQPLQTDAAPPARPPAPAGHPPAPPAQDPWSAQLPPHADAAPPARPPASRAQDPWSGQAPPWPEAAPPARPPALRGRPSTPPTQDPSAQPPPHRRDQAPPVDPAALDSSGMGGRRPSEPDSPFGPSFEVEPPFLAEPFEAETPAGTGPYPDERAPFAEEHPPFPDERTPFGGEQTPFPDGRTQFGDDRAPFGDEQAPFAPPPEPPRRRPDAGTPPLGAQPPGHGFDEPVPGERGGPEPDQGMAALYDLGLEEPGVTAPPPAPQTSLGPAAPSAPEPPAQRYSDDQAEETAGSPMVLGVRCKNGHFTDPDARSCVVCGAGIRRRSVTPEHGPRPALGVLILEDGATVAVDGDYVVGRDPARDQSVSAGEARPLRVVDAESTVSRIHAEVRLDGWQVLLTDLGSANGTRIQQPGAKAEQMLDPRVPVPLQLGARIFVGASCLRYERTGS